MVTPSESRAPRAHHRWQRAGAAIGVVGLLVGLGYFIDFLLHGFDPTRVVYKRLKAGDQYLYEAVHPRFLTTDPGALITIRTPGDATERRQRLTAAIWGTGGYPLGRLPGAITRDVDEPGFKHGAAIARIDRVEVDMGNDIRSIFAHFHPARPNGGLVVYHHGYAGTYTDNARVIDRLVAEGYAVMALNLMAYGDNTGALKVADGPDLNLHFDLDKIDRPMRYHFEPVVRALNYAEQSYDYRSIDMMGFSAGGFTTAVVAALDPRIRRSYPIAGVYPIYLRDGQDVLANGPPYYKPMLDAANYLDMFVLGVDSRERRQMQIFNRFDRCCFNNVKGRLYVDPVRGAAAAIRGGAFDVVIDETHADHKVSNFALDRVVEDMVRP